jgi:hypothetical protein
MNTFCHTQKFYLRGRLKFNGIGNSALGDCRVQAGPGRVPRQKTKGEVFGLSL